MEPSLRWEDFCQEVNPDFPRKGKESSPLIWRCGAHRPAKWSQWMADRQPLTTKNGDEAAFSRLRALLPRSGSQLSLGAAGYVTCTELNFPSSPGMQRPPPMSIFCSLRKPYHMELNGWMQTIHLDSNHPRASLEVRPLWKEQHLYRLGCHPPTHHGMPEGSPIRIALSALPSVPPVERALNDIQEPIPSESLSARDVGARNATDSPPT